MTDSTSLPPGDWPAMQPGWVWLCGAGPGDPGLLTLHALNALAQADVIVHDALVDDRILGWANPAAELVYAGKRGGKPSARQKDISLQLIDLARAGKKVLRLKGGDPFVFGRGGEEGQTLVQHGVPIRIIPGISAGIGGLAYAGIPVTHRDVNQAVTFVTGHDRQGRVSGVDWTSVAKSSGVIVIYMGMKHLADIAADLMAAGRGADEPVAIVAQATLPDQQVLETTLATCAADAEASGIGAPAVICVGRAALLRQALDWQSLAMGTPPRNADPLGLGRPVEDG
ncbi:uroporphyrinogen-III C-methyltransferase [Maritimibacter dapengensis]|uniref:uroporphyrinogen-III C-methyltransferase n=1 Tax=Maritimibacter dapengensis TaxID=2836868 RepID=A0ABS6T2A4_9RHOB|nr:uroporphyrinogen-III C-methyltransferase [Maritimibacter dapengensis]MBV7378497.1 uroporphyrinogen-III C-methyltransferase [Maritimibacter dapengensis]